MQRRQTDRKQGVQGEEVGEQYFCIHKMSHFFFKDVARTLLWGHTILGITWGFGPYNLFHHNDL